MQKLLDIYDKQHRQIAVTAKSPEGNPMYQLAINDKENKEENPYQLIYENGLPVFINGYPSNKIYTIFLTSFVEQFKNDVREQLHNDHPLPTQQEKINWLKKLKYRIANYENLLYPAEAYHEEHAFEITQHQNTTFENIPMENGGSPSNQVLVQISDYLEIQQTYRNYLLEFLNDQIEFRKTVEYLPPRKTKSRKPTKTKKPALNGKAKKTAKGKAKAKKKIKTKPKQKKTKKSKSQ